MLSGRGENLMEGFGVHTSMWSMSWDRAGAELAIAKAASYNVDFVEIALLNAVGVDAHHSRKLLEKHNLGSVCSLGERRLPGIPVRAISSSDQSLVD